MIYSETQDLFGSLERQEPIIDNCLTREEAVMILLEHVRLVSINQKRRSYWSSLDLEPMWYSGKILKYSKFCLSFSDLNIYIAASPSFGYLALNYFSSTANPFAAAYSHIFVTFLSSFLYWCWLCFLGAYANWCKNRHPFNGLNLII
jgi:hypothetical protein